MSENKLKMWHLVYIVLMIFWQLLLNNLILAFFTFFHFLLSCFASVGHWFGARNDLLYEKMPTVTSFLLVVQVTDNIIDKVLPLEYQIPRFKPLSCCLSSQLTYAFCHCHSWISSQKCPIQARIPGLLNMPLNT